MFTLLNIRSPPCGLDFPKRVPGLPHPHGQPHFPSAARQRRRWQLIPSRLFTTDPRAVQLI